MQCAKHMLERQLTAQGMQLRAKQAHGRRVLREWHQMAAYRKDLRDAVASGLQAQESRLLGQALASWTVHVEQQR